MIHYVFFVIGCLLLGHSTDAAFEDFVVQPETEQFAAGNELMLDCPSEAADEQSLISFQDVEHDGIVDTQLLLSALMQHAQRLGMNLDQLAQMHALEEDNAMASNLGCGAAKELSYQEQPSWYDVFFN